MPSVFKAIYSICLHRCKSIIWRILCPCRRGRFFSCHWLLPNDAFKQTVHWIPSLLRKYAYMSKLASIISVLTSAVVLFQLRAFLRSLYCLRNCKCLPPRLFCIHQHRLMRGSRNSRSMRVILSVIILRIFRKNVCGSRLSRTVLDNMGPSRPGHIYGLMYYFLSCYLPWNLNECLRRNKRALIWRNDRFVLFTMQSVTLCG